MTQDTLLKTPAQELYDRLHAPTDSTACDTHDHEEKGACGGTGECGGEGCSSTNPFDDPNPLWLPPKSGWEAFWVQQHRNALQFALSFLDHPPQRILFMGGCRQWMLARDLGIQFPLSAIVLADGDAPWVDHARQSLKCRFRFLYTPPGEALPFEDGAFDWVLSYGHTPFLAGPVVNAGISELSRVGQTHLTVAWEHQPGRRKWLKKWLPGYDVTEDRIGAPQLPPERRLDSAPESTPPAPRDEDLIRSLWRYARPKDQVSPWFWRVTQWAMIPGREDQTRLS